MASFNQISICGYLGRDPELRHTPQGLAVANFSIASTEKRKEGSESQEITTWFRVTLWGKQAEVAAEYLRKGSHVYVTGSVRLNEYTDREGTARVSLEVNASAFHMLGGKADGQASEGRAMARGASANPQVQLIQGSRTETAELVDEDIPF